MVTSHNDAVADQPISNAVSDRHDGWPATLAKDLSVVCSVKFDPADLLGRHDGAASRFIGTLATLKPEVGQAVEELTRLWSEQAIAEAAEPAVHVGPGALSIPSLDCPSGRLLDGLKLSSGGGEQPLDRLADLVSTAVEIIGGVENAWYLRPRIGAEPMMGWVARLHAGAALSRISNSVDASKPSSAADVAAELYGIAGAIYTEAAQDSIWFKLLRLIRTEAFGIITAHHDYSDLDLERDDSNFWLSFDQRNVLTIPADHFKPDKVLQIVRLPVGATKGLVARAGKGKHD